jgi:hypothetical protein
MDPTWATVLGVYDNTQLILFDPNAQALNNINSYLNKTGEPNERAFLTPFSLYYNFGLLLRYTVGYSQHRVLKTSWRDILGLPGVCEIKICVYLIMIIASVSLKLYQSVNLYTIGKLTRFDFPSLLQQADTHSYTVYRSNSTEWDRSL